MAQLKTNLFLVVRSLNSDSILLENHLLQERRQHLANPDDNYPNGHDQALCYSQVPSRLCDPGSPVGTRLATLNLVPLVHDSLLGSYSFGLGISKKKKETSRSSPPHFLQKLVNGSSSISHRLQGNRNKLWVQSFNIETVSQPPSSYKEECHESYES